MAALETVLVVFCVLSLSVSAVSRLLVCLVVRHTPSAGASRAHVTVLKPLCGAEATLDENLAKLGEQSHDELDVVLGVASAHDPAMAAAVRFCRQHVGLRARIHVGESARVDNPKVALLERMGHASEAEWVVVSDSNVRVTERYVEDALARAEPDVGLVTHLVAGDGGRSLAAHLENLQLNCFVAPGVCAVRFIAGRTCVIGKSMFLRREALDEIGGFSMAGGYLAEDYVLGRAIARAGYRVVTASTPVTAWHEGWTLRRFVNRHLRWAVMRRRVSPLGYVTELLLTPAPALIALLGVALWAPSSQLDARWIGVSLALEQGLDALTYQRMTGARVPLAAPLLNPARQCLTLGVWLLGWFVQTVQWRGKTYRIGRDSRLTPARALEAGVADEA